MPARKAALGFIFIALFIDVLGIGLVVPILPKLLGSLLDGDEVRASHYFGAFTATYALMQLFCSPLLGSLSDRLGRRSVLLVSRFGQGLDYILMAFAPTLGWLYLGRVIAGITGAGIGTASAYIADVTPPEKRAQAFGLVGTAFGLGFIAGPALGGYLGKIDLRLPFLVAAGLALTNALYGVLVLPESLDPANRRPFSWKRANPFGTLSALGRYPLVAGMAAALFFLNLAQRGLENTWVLYTGHRYLWDPVMTGLSLAAVGLGAAIVQGGLSRVVIPRTGERRALLIGIVIASVSFVLYGLAPQGWMVFVIIPFNSLAGLAGPAAQALMSKSVPVNEQGMLQGGLASLNSLTQIVGPLIATNAFAYFIAKDAPVQLPGIPFFIGAVFLMIGLFLSLRAFSRNPAAR